MDPPFRVMENTVKGNTETGNEEKWKRQNATVFVRVK
jgi:hypothetical protein